MMLRVHCPVHAHHFCFSSFTQEAEPAQTTNNKYNENAQDNIIATQCAAVAEGATEVATTADAATEPIEAPLSPLNFDAFRTSLYGDTRNEEAARRSRTRAVDMIVLRDTLSMIKVS